MRMRAPRRLDDAAGATGLARLTEKCAGQRRGGDEIGGELDGFQRGRLGGFTILAGKRLRLSGEQYGALAAVGFLVDEPGPLAAIERGQRAGPVARGTAQLEHGARRPGQSRRRIQGALRVAPRGGHVAFALRLDEEAAQPEKPSVVMLCHRGEAALSRLAITAQLGGLSIEQQRERLAPNQPAGVAGMPRGGAVIAGTHREQPMREGLVAARFAAPARRVRRAHQRTQDRPEGRREHGHGDERPDHDRDRGRDLTPHPDDGDRALLISHPASGERQRAQNDEKYDDPDHAASLFKICRAPRARRLQHVGRRQAPQRALEL